MKRAAPIFVLLTLAMLWPLARHPASMAPPHQDVYFNMWRLRWFAHALATQPTRIFDANIFHPEKDTLALSDAMIVEGVVAAPLVWSGVPPVLVHSIMLLLPIAASGLAMFALARHLTGSAGAGLLAGIAFAFAPYRFEHVMHMELQWTMWMPLAFLALHRTLETGRWRWGLATGAAIALQMLSCIYYGIFLATLIAPAGLLLALSERALPWRKWLLPLAAGAVVAVALSAVYAMPFLRQHARVGDRVTEDVNAFSARPANYLNVPVDNWLYGDSGRPGRPERRLFPGAIVVLLAIVGLLWRTPSRRAIVYLLLIAVAFEVSLGYSGYLYPFLQRVLSPYRGLRAMARLGIFVVMGLSVLAAFGYAELMRDRLPMIRRLAVAVLSVLMLAEYATAFPVIEFSNTPPALYKILQRQPPGIVAELPMPVGHRLPGNDPERAYMSTFHWKPLVNGYSGNYPVSYLQRLERMEQFPDERSLRQLRHDEVRYVIVHCAEYSQQQLETIRLALANAQMMELGRFDDGGGSAILFSTR